MNIYRWYSDALCIGGITCARHIADAEKQAFDYLKHKFPWNEESIMERGYEDIRLDVWSITDDDDYDTEHPLTVATSY